MVRFTFEDTGERIRRARLDAGLTQAELADRAALSQPSLAQMESGRRHPSPEMLERVLRAADYRPSLPLSEHADAIAAAAARRGLTNVRVFGSTVRGEDGFDSDIDLLVTPSAGSDLMDIALFANDVRQLTGFPADVVADTRDSRGYRARGHPAMTGQRRGSRFQPKARRSSTERAANDRQRFRHELIQIRRRTQAVANSDRAAFAEGSPTYDVASMVIIRFAALLERSEFADFTHLLSADEITAIRTTRNIVAHAGYEGTNDDLFWAAVTIRVPAMIQRLLEDEPALGQ